MTLSVRHIFGLVAAVLLIVCVFVGIEYHNAFHHALAVPPVSRDAAGISRLIAAYHELDETPGLTRALARSLAPGQPIRGLVFAVFLGFTPSKKQVAAYLHHAQFGPVRGLARAAQYHFGVPYSKLTAGEVLLLCDLAQGAKRGTTAPAGHLPMHDPIAALHRRDALLSDLHASGFLSLAEYRNERARALSLSASHRPVN